MRFRTRRALQPQAISVQLPARKTLISASISLGDDAAIYRRLSDCRIAAVGIYARPPRRY